MQTAPFWDKPLADIADKFGKLRKIGLLSGKETSRRIPAKDPIAAAKILDKYVGKDGTMTKEQQQAYRQGVSRQADHSRGGSDVETRRLQRRLPLPRLRQDLALIGKAFAEALVTAAEV